MMVTAMMTSKMTLKIERNVYTLNLSTKFIVATSIARLSVIYNANLL